MRQPPRAFETYRLLLDLTGFGQGPGGEKADLLPLLGWQMLEKGKQLFKHVRLRNTVGVKEPDPVEAVFQAVGQTDPNRAARAQVFRIANNRNVFGEGSVQSSIGRRVVDDQDSVKRPGLTPKPLEQMLDHIGVVHRVHMGQNAHRAVLIACRDVAG